MNSGTIVSINDGHFVFVGDALKRARIKYGLAEDETFLGVVGERVFYESESRPGVLFFFSTRDPQTRFYKKIKRPRDFSWSWKVEHLEQVFATENPQEICARAIMHNHALLSIFPRVDYVGVLIDVSKAKPVTDRRN